MLHSMTGFGRGTSTTENYHAVIELSSVNRKQAELSFSAARELSALEPKIRNIVFQKISRGRVQVNLSLNKTHALADTFAIDHTLARSLKASIEKLSQEIGQPLTLTSADILRFPGMVTNADSSAELDTIWLCVEPALLSALEEFQTSRSAEGKNLCADITARLATIEKMLDTVKTLAPNRSARQKELLIKRLQELDCPIDPAEERLLKELAIFADRADISEEITRLTSHLTKFHSYIQAAESTGRPLDFLCQEIHREWNTIGSKAYDAQIAQTVVEAKTELEKIREQIQNVE